MNKKFKILSNNPVKRRIGGCVFVLYRIVAIKTFISDNRKIHPGEFGGLISSESNLSQDGNCWVFPEAIVADNAKVRDNAVIGGNAVIKEDAIIEDNACILNRAVIKGNARIKDNASISGCAVVGGFATIEDNAIVSDFSKIGGKACIKDYARVLNGAMVLGYSCVSGKSVICDNAILEDHSQVCNTKISENSRLGLYANITSDNDEPITVSGNSYITTSVTPIIDTKARSFEISNALLMKDEDFFIIPLCYTNKNDFLIKYSSPNGPMIYNSLTGRCSTLKEYKDKGIKIFRDSKFINTLTIQDVSPFVKWVEKYDVYDIEPFNVLADNLIDSFEPVSTIKEKEELLPVYLISSYIELHLLSIPFLIGLNIPDEIRHKLKRIVERIIDMGTLDIYTKEIVDFSKAVFNNEILTGLILKACETSKSEKICINKSDNIILLST